MRDYTRIWLLDRGAKPLIDFNAFGPLHLQHGVDSEKFEWDGNSEAYVVADRGLGGGSWQTLLPTSVQFFFHSNAVSAKNMPNNRLTPPSGVGVAWICHYSAMLKFCMRRCDTSGGGIWCNKIWCHEFFTGRSDLDRGIWGSQSFASQIFSFVGVKFSLTTPVMVRPGGVNHNTFIIMVHLGGLIITIGYYDNPPLLWLTPPFVMDYWYCDIE